MSGQYDSTLGALCVGVLTAGCLWGVSCAQVWRYFHQYVEDDAWVKLLVAAAWLFDTADQALISYGLYHYTVTNFGNKDVIAQAVPALGIQTIFQGLTAFLVQFFFAWRIWKMSRKHKVLTSIIAVLVVGQLAIVIANTVGNYRSNTVEDLALYNRVMTPVGVGISVLADLAIAVVLTYFLSSGRTGADGHPSSASANSIIDQFIAFSMSTGVLTSVFALVILITLLTLPRSFVWMAIFFVIGRVYMNSLMVALNMRASMRRRWTVPPPDSRSFTVHLSTPVDVQSPVSPLNDFALKDLRSINTIPSSA